MWVIPVLYTLGLLVTWPALYKVALNSLLHEPDEEIRIATAAASLGLSLIWPLALLFLGYYWIFLRPIKYNPKQPPPPD